MCFSAEASFVVSGVLTVTGALTLQKAPSNLRLISCIPLIFALQQALEGLVWLTLTHGDSTSLIHKSAMYGYILFAGAFWPVWIPAVLYELETKVSRKKWLKAALCVGIFISSASILSLIVNGREAIMIGHHISYRSPLNPSMSIPHWLISRAEWGLLGLYAIVVTSSSFISSFKYFWVFGILVAGAWLLATIYYYTSSGSIWCFFSALSSAIIYLIVTQENKGRR